ncbi:transcriptional regulator, partial [Citrobacter freundii]
MSLLMTSRPIVINPDLAYSIGLNEAIALQQINYWLQETKSGMESDGVRWIYNTTEQWLEQFPFWSESTLKRTFTRLKTLGVLKIEQLNKSQRDMTNFYTINYESELLDEVKVTESKRSKCAVPSGQNDTMEEVKVKRSIRSKRTDVIRSKCTDDLTENTT